MASKGRAKICGIYAITKDGEVVYVGHSINIRSRWAGHRSALRSSRHKNPHLQNSWNDHGEESFEFVVLEECPVELLVEREQYHMDLYPDRYNCHPAAGSPLGFRHTEESKAKMSESKMGNTHKVGYVATPEAKANMSAAATGRKASDEAREKIRQSLMGREVSPDTRARIGAANRGHTRNLGIKRSDETKARMSEARKAWWARKRAEEAID